MAQSIHTIALRESLGHGRAQSPGFDVDVCTCAGSVGLLPKSLSAKRYCATALSGWALFGGVYFVPKQSAELVLRILTKLYRCRVDGEVVS
jgi:hypothetical protein